MSRLRRNLQALFPLPSERQIVSYRQVFHAPDDEEDEIEYDDPEEYDVEEFYDIEDSDDEAGVTWTEAVYDYLENQGVSNASSSSFHAGIWYLAGDESWDVNGEIEERTYHLKGFTPGEEKEIYHLLKRRKVIY